MPLRQTGWTVHWPIQGRIHFCRKVPASEVGAPQWVCAPPVGNPGFAPAVMVTEAVLVATLDDVLGQIKAKDLLQTMNE